MATVLSESGFQVYATGRTIERASLPEAVVRIPCDHTRDDETLAVFDQINSQGRDLELLVNCAWGGYERIVEDGQITWSEPFWWQPRHRWRAMIDTGVRSAFVCSAEAAKVMVPGVAGSS